MSNFLDLYVLQSVPASCINRDDSNMPKTVIYGGTLRSRVSSQAWKHAMREDFKKYADQDDLFASHRTLLIPQLLSAEIQKQAPDVSKEDADQLSIKVIKDTAGIKMKKNEMKTSALLFLSQVQIEKLAQLALTHADTLEQDKKEVKSQLTRILKKDNSLDLALFGRMVADDANLSTYASSQVAHAFSVNTIEPEYDYFSAADDDSHTQGSAMLDAVGYNSSTLYRYANINLSALKHNLGDAEDVFIKGIKFFIKDFALSMPTGKENSYANKTLPYYVLAVIRDDTPVNLASAFESAIDSNHGFMQLAINRLEEENKKDLVFVDKPVFSYVSTTLKSNINNQGTLNELIENITNQIKGE